LRIERYAATLPPEQRDDLLTGWPYFSRNASEAELENISRKLDRDFPEGNNATRKGRRHVPIDDRVVERAAKLDPEKAADILRRWEALKAVFTSDELEAMYTSHRAGQRVERRERGRQELQALFDLGDGESSGPVGGER
jgi:hypothetical protein